MLPKQIPLPTLETRQICIGCKRPADLLGQWSPGNIAYLCRECSIANPMPDIFEEKPSTGKIRITADSSDADRYTNVHMENMLDRLKRGCKLTIADADPARGLPCESHEYPIDLNCRLCKREMKRHTRRITEGMHPALAGIRIRQHVPKVAYAKLPTIRDQMSLPICQRCGNVHNRRFGFNDNYQPYCQSCDDKWSVESFYNHRGIFGGDDVEEIFDRIQRAEPGLFERGVLPDYWFELALRDKEGIEE
jgi:hypothetical protein